VLLLKAFCRYSCGLADTSRSFNRSSKVFFFRHKKREKERKILRGKFEALRAFPILFCQLSGSQLCGSQVSKEKKKGGF
jgi:hypothetical protein